MMSPTHYLPSEALQYSNYPEVYSVSSKLREFQKRLEPIMTAVSAYDLGTTDGIYVNIDEVEKVLDLTFDITEVLGNAENVCFDILLPVRSAQEALNELIFSFRYEDTPIVFDKQRTDMKRLNSVVNKSGELI